MRVSEILCLADLIRAEVGDKWCRDADRSIRLLVLFKKSHVKSWKSSAGSVQGVTKTIIPLLVLEPELHTTSLVVGEI